MIDKSKIIVTIDRSEMHRRYQLNTINEDGTFTSIGEPLSPKEFHEVHGFSCHFPYDDKGPVNH